MSVPGSTADATVIIPAYNAEACVAQAIDSALEQTVPPLEILVVDDGSRDATKDVVARYRSPVRLIQQRNAGPGAARNRAAREARGTWLAFLDADDSWLPTKLEKQLSIGTDPQVGIIHSRSLDHWSLQRGVVLDFATVWKKNPIALSAAVVRRSAFEQVGGFSERRAMDSVADYNLWLRLLAAHWTIATYPEVLYRYTPAPGNLSSQTERFAEAELANLHELARQIGVDATLVRRKEVAVLTEYARELMFFRKMRPARSFFARALAKQPSARTLLWLGATYAPVELLNYFRKTRDVRHAAH